VGQYSVSTPQHDRLLLFLNAKRLRHHLMRARSKEPASYTVTTVTTVCPTSDGLLSALGTTPADAHASHGSNGFR
jgi:hypothetical protein